MKILQNRAFALIYILVLICALGGICIYIRSLWIYPALALGMAGAYMISAYIDGMPQKGLKIEINKYTEICTVCLCVIFIMQICTALYSNFEPINDLGYICAAAKDHIIHGAEHIYDHIPEERRGYFAIYPNNHSLYLVIYSLYNIEYFITGHISNILPTVFNILCLDISYILMCKTALLIYTPDRAAGCAVKGLLFTPIFTYAPFFYTDSIAMPFVSLGVYLYVRYRKNAADTISFHIRYMALTGLVIGIGYKLKGSVGLLLAAICIDILFLRRDINIPKKLLCISAAVISMAAACMLISSAGRAVLGLTCDQIDTYSFPLTHWVMMSSDGLGGYNNDDFLYTRSFTGRSAKIWADISRLIYKLAKQGFLGFGAHILGKLSYTWRDGGYMAGYYLGGFFKSAIFYIYATLCHLTLLISLIRGFLKPRESKYTPVLRLTLMLLTFFLLVWEARCRYLVSFFILFALI